MDRRCVARGKPRNSGVGSCTNVSGLSVKRDAPGHHGYERLAAKPQRRAVRVTSSRLRREDRSSIALFHTLADLGGIAASGHGGASTIFPCSAGRSLSLSRPCAYRRAPWRGPVKAGPFQGRPAGLGLDKARLGARIMPAGAHCHGLFGPRSRGHNEALPRRSGRACWRARSPTCCGAAAWQRPRSRP